MGIDLGNPKQMFEDIRDHIGHEINCVRYGEGDECVNVAIECETCGCILISQDNPDHPQTAEKIAAKEFDWEEYSRRTKATQDRVDAACEGDGHLIYSCADRDPEDKEMPLDNLDKVLAEGCVRLSYHGWESPVLQSPTMLQVAVLANEAIKSSGDLHHVFLEGTRLLGDRNESGKRIVIYGLCFGS